MYTNRVNVLTKLIVQALEEITSPVIDETTNRHVAENLQRYLSHPDTCDIVYSKIISRLKKYKENLLIWTRSVSIIKSNISRLPPKRNTLLALRECLCSVTLRDKALLRSLRYLCAVISSKIDKGGPLVRGQTTILSKATSTQELQSIVPQTKRPLVFVFNMLHHRTGLTKCFSYGEGAQTARRKRSGSVILSTRKAKRPEVRFECFELAIPENAGVDSRIGFRLDDAVKNRKGIKNVGISKKSEETIAFKQAGVLPVRRRSVRLFSYKYYTEQQPLYLDDTDMKSMQSAIIDPPGNNPEARNIASKILIKYLIDEFIAGNSDAAITTLLNIIKELLEDDSDDSSEAAGKLCAFNIIFNFAIHVNMINEDAICSNETDSKKFVGMIDKLFGVLKDMLFIMLHHEDDPRVWNVAFNCLLFFITHKGQIMADKIATLDHRLFPMFLKYLDKPFERRQLIRMLTNLLYYNEENVLDIQALKRCGGIDFIAELYTSVSGLEALQNLFIILFDYAADQLKKPLSKNQLVGALRALQIMNAPTLIVQFFQSTDADIGCTIFLKYFHSKGPVEQLQVIPRKDLQYAEVVVKQIQVIAEHYTQLDPDYESKAELMIAADSSRDEYAKKMHSLLHSSNDFERRNGELWLWDLVKSQYDAQDNGKIDPNLHKIVQTEFLALLKSSRPEMRLMYLRILEKSILHLRYKASLKGQSTNDVLLPLMNEAAQNLIATREKSEKVLKKLLDLLMNFMSVRIESQNEKPEEDDTIYGQFLDGLVVLSVSSLLKLDISIFLYLFRSLPARRAYRTTSLLLLMNKCVDKEALKVVGGMSFFRNLLMNRDPEVAFHASKFLISRLQDENPEQYQAVFNRLIARAQQTHNEGLLWNPYEQIRAIIKGL